MTIRVVAQGGIDVRGVSVNGGEHQVNKNGNQTEVNASPNDSVLLRVDRNGEGNVEVPPLTDYDRQRGWRRLNTSHNGVIAFGIDEDKVVLLPRPDLNSWMSNLPDDRALADLTIPGTHQSASLYGGFISECQTGDVNQQLHDGVRFFDIRVRLVDGELQVYHGIQPQNSILRQQVEWIEQFLRENPREAVICSIKQENDAYPDFPVKVWDTLQSGMWRFDEGLPTLGETRGKATFFSRFDRTSNEQFPSGQGMKPSRWPDNKGAGFDASIGDTLFRIHDWYDTSDIAAKSAAIEQHLEPTLEPRGNGTGPNHPFTLDFTSGGKFPQAPPQWFASGGESGGVSKLIGGAATFLGNLTGGGGETQGNSGPQGGVNARLVKWLLSKAFEGRRPRATLMLDFYKETGGSEAGIAEIMAALNLMNDQ